MDTYKTSALCIQFVHDEMKLVEPYTGLSFDINILQQHYLLDVLNFCEHPKDFEQVVQYLFSLDNSFSAKKCESAVYSLIKNGLLISTSNFPYGENRDSLGNWIQNGWSDALNYHLYTNLLKKTDYSTDPKGVEDKKMMRSYLDVESPPPAYKCNINEENIRLIPYSKINMEQKVVSSFFKSGVNDYKESLPLNFKEFSWYMHLAFGQTGTKNLPITGAHIKKTVPSGGSRHPTEVYPIIFSVDGISPGLYHYCVQHHALKLIKLGDHLDFVRKHIITHPTRPHFNFYAGFIFSTIFERSMFRYRESRSYRVMQYDLGHLMQNSAYIASAMGRNSYRGYSFHDSIVDAFIQVDGISEAAMSFKILG